MDNHGIYSVIYTVSIAFEYTFTQSSVEVLVPLRLVLTYQKDCQVLIESEISSNPVPIEFYQIYSSVKESRKVPFIRDPHMCGTLQACQLFQ